MRIASVADVKAKFSSFLRESKGGPVIVTRNGKPVGVLLSVEDEGEIERLLLAYSPRFQKVLAAGKQQIQSMEGISHQEFWKEAGKQKGRSRRQKQLPASSDHLG